MFNAIIHVNSIQEVHKRFENNVPLLDPDEARFARTSVEMMRNGDPVVPQFESRDTSPLPDTTPPRGTSARVAFATGAASSAA